MKKTFRIRMTIISIILIGLIVFGIYLLVKNSSKKYEIEEVKEYNYFVVKQDNLYGVIDRSGNIVVDAKYDDVKIPNPEKAIFLCTKDENIKILNEKGEEILTQYEKVEAIRLKNISGDLMYEKSTLKYKENGKYGIINFAGKKITKAIYDEIENLPYKEGELLVKQNDKYGVININGGKIVNIEYDQISVDEYYSDGDKYKYAGYIISNKTQEGYRYGYINYKGELLEDIEYNELSRNNDVDDKDNIYLICAKNGQYGVTQNGKKILENEYQSINFDKTNNVFVIEKSKKYGIANLTGKIVVPVEYSQIDITGIYLYAQNAQGITVYNSDGSQVNIDTNIAILNTDNEKYRIKINSEEGTKYGIIKKDGTQIIKEKYNYIEYLYDNYFIVSNEESKLGVINDKDEEKIKIMYDSIQKVQDTDIIQTSISENKTTYLFSKDMNQICEMENALVETYDNYIKIYNENEVKYFDKEGKELKNTEVYPNNKLFTKEENGKYGYINSSNKIVVDCKYDQATEFNEYGFAAVKLDGKWGVINDQGTEIVSPMFEFNNGTIPSFIGKYYKMTYGFGAVYYTNDK